MNIIFLLIMTLAIFFLAAFVVAVVYYRRLVRLKKKYKYIIGQLNLASSIYYGLNKNVAMPVSEEST